MCLAEDRHGLIDGVAETTASLVKIYSGALSDKLGKRKWLAVLGYGLSTISKPFLYFANTWGWVFGVRFSDRVGKGIRTAPRDALVAASTDEKNGLAFACTARRYGRRIFGHRHCAYYLVNQTNDALLSENIPHRSTGEHCPQFWR
jgi:hypothetical protein